MLMTRKQLVESLNESGRAMMQSLGMAVVKAEGQRMHYDPGYRSVKLIQSNRRRKS